MLDLKIDRADPQPLHEQIAAGVRRLILTRAIPTGAHLPPTRQLARALRVNRGTVVQAYARLRAEGLVEGQVGRGTVVRPATKAWRPVRHSLSWPTILGPIDQFVQNAVEVAGLFSGRANIAFAAGFPSSELYPMDRIAAITAELLETRGPELLSDGAVQGAPELRRVVAEELRCMPSEVFVVSGSQQGLSLLARVFLSPGDVVLAELPTYLGALQVFHETGARVVGLPLDAEGMDPQMLEDVLSRMPVRLLYTVPSFQNPTGASLSFERRQAVLEIASRYGVPVIEDDPYGLLAYDAEPPSTLWSLDEGGHVIYVGTCSKTLFPGLRVGWVAAPEPVVDRLLPVKLRTDLFTSPLSQAVVAAFRGSPAFGRHLDELRRVYRVRRDAMVAGLRRHCAGIDFSVPGGGYFVWARLTEGMAARDLLGRAVEEGVSLLTGDLFYPEGRGEEAIRLTFASETPERILEGTKRLGRALHRTARQEREARGPKRAPGAIV
jgi:2-aminoadipate transaminase